MWICGHKPGETSFPLGNRLRFSVRVPDPPLFLAQTARNPWKKQGFRTLKILEKESKNAQKSQENRKKKARKTKNARVAICRIRVTFANFLQAGPVSEGRGWGGSWIRRGWVRSFGLPRFSVQRSLCPYLKGLWDLWTENQNAPETGNPTMTDPITPSVLALWLFSFSREYHCSQNTLIIKMITCNYFCFRELIFWWLQLQLHFLIRSWTDSREMK